MIGGEKRGAGVSSLAQTLAEFLRDDKYVYKYLGGRLPLAEINVLPQPRKTFFELEAFSLNIAEKGLLNPPTIARFTRDGAGQYIATINLVWNTSFSLQDLHAVKQGRKIFFYILIAGERRLRACQMLQSEGCSECKGKYGAGSPEARQCFLRHFGGDTIEVRVCVDIPPLAALFLQHSENTHLRPLPHEEAHAYSALWKLVKYVDPKYPLARFARKIDRSPDTVRNALLFCRLPEDVQDAVIGGLIPYGVGVELASLETKAKLSGEELTWWFMRSVSENYKVAEFRAIAQKYIRHKASGQISMLEIMQEKQDEILARHVRETVEKNTVKAVYSWLYYFRRVLTLFEEGKLGKKDSPFSHESPVRLTRKLCAELQRLFTHLEGLLKDEELFELRRQVALVDAALSYLS